MGQGCSTTGGDSGGGGGGREGGGGVGGRAETTGDHGRLRAGEEIRHYGLRWLGGTHLEPFSPHSLYLARNSTLS